MHKLFRIIKLSKILKINTNIIINTDISNISNNKKVELETIRLFHLIDERGFTTNMQWFLTLNKIQLIKYIKEVLDIWNYRAQLTNSMKKNICPPNGILLNLNLNQLKIYLRRPKYHLQFLTLTLIKKLITSSNDEDLKYLGMTYVLGGLTIVNQNAANSLSWLYYAFMINNQ